MGCFLFIWWLFRELGFLALRTGWKGQAGSGWRRFKPERVGWRSPGQKSSKATWSLTFGGTDEI